MGVELLTMRCLLQNFMIPLKQERILDEQQVDTIFYKIHEIMMYHVSFLNTLQSWESSNSVGDKIFEMVDEGLLVYNCFAVMQIKTKESRTKLPLKALIVQPAQRIPRYELLIKRLLESTPGDYADYKLLQEAEVAVHKLALRVNTVKEAKQDEAIVEGLKLLEKLLAPASLSANREYVRHDIVSVEDRKDPACIFLFTDQIVMTATKRRGAQPLRKPFILRLPTQSGHDILENVKYKIYQKISIESIEFESAGEFDPDRRRYQQQQQHTEPIYIAREHQTRLNDLVMPLNGRTAPNEFDCEGMVQHKELKDKKDITLLAEIENISRQLEHRHQARKDRIFLDRNYRVFVSIRVKNGNKSKRKMIYELYKCVVAGSGHGCAEDVHDDPERAGRPALGEDQQSDEFQRMCVQVQCDHKFEITFPSVEKRNSWEKTVKEIRQKLGAVPRTPIFSEFLRIPKTLSGMQLSCAATTETGIVVNSVLKREVWICTSDGFTGHLSLLKLYPQPSVSSNVSIAGCNSRVTAICPVPGYVVGNANKSSVLIESRLVKVQATSRPARCLLL
ncbi:Rho guanine nucleotide exchange factor (GEF) 17 [Cichlidogyrus casuarinus]|uniref:Rho guanine nucleotide exchange factor (GEF) 17 n=1 Tax=Cichlidogyrus casuarinus TaxID=1844966 RepID=A0ABD2PW76_9PLAT